MSSPTGFKLQSNGIFDDVLWRIIDKSHTSQRMATTNYDETVKIRDRT